MEIIITVLVMVLVPAAFLFGRWKDPFWSARMERNMMKKDVVMLGLLSKDRQSARYYKLNPTAGVFVHKGKIWFADKKEICRASINEEVSKLIDLKKVQNVSIKTVQSRYRYGLDKLRIILDGQVQK